MFYLERNQLPEVFDAFCW